MANGREELLQIAADIFELEKGETWTFTTTSSGLEIPHFIWETPKAVGNLAIRSIQYRITRTTYDITRAMFVARDPDGDLIVGLQPGSVHDDPFTREYILDPFRAFVTGHDHSICERLGSERRDEIIRRGEVEIRAQTQWQDPENLGAA